MRSWAVSGDGARLDGGVVLHGGFGGGSFGRHGSNRQLSSYPVGRYINLPWQSGKGSRAQIGTLALGKWTVDKAFSTDSFTTPIHQLL